MWIQYLPLLSSRVASAAVPRLVLSTHTTTCPTNKKAAPKKAGVRDAAKKPAAAVASSGLKSDKRSVCAAPGAGGSGAGGKLALPVRGPPGKVRLGFLPDEWFLFLQPKTGVTGPYVLGIALANYLLSKEIYVLEHEYYSGLSIAAMVIFVAVKMGPAIGAALDKQVDAFEAEWQSGRDTDINHFKKVIAEAELAQKRAEGQKILMDAKKENVLMQLEAAYRERSMSVYSAVRGRMDYQVKKYHADARIQQKWMIEWILSNVRRSITPELMQQALTSAIAELEAVASRPPAQPAAPVGPAPAQ